MKKHQTWLFCWFVCIILLLAGGITGYTIGLAVVSADNKRIREENDVLRNQLGLWEKEGERALAETRKQTAIAKQQIETLNPMAQQYSEGLETLVRLTDRVQAKPVVRDYDTYAKSLAVSVITIEVGGEIVIPDSPNKVFFMGYSEGDGKATLHYDNIFQRESGREARQPNLMPLEEVPGTPSGARAGLVWIGRSRIFVFDIDPKTMRYAVIPEE